MYQRRVFEDRIAVVTGATSGIGQKIAELLLERGAKVHALGRDEARLAAIAAKGATPHAVDLTKLDPDALAFECVDLLVHSAGVCTLGSIEEAPVEQLDHNYAVNLRAPVLLTQRLLPALLTAKGQVVFVNSGAGLSAKAGWGHYAASKFGLKAIADSLREEVKPRGVRVMTVYPGRTATPMQAEVRRMEGATYDPDAYIDPADVARMVVEAAALPRTADVIDLNIRTGPG